MSRNSYKDMNRNNYYGKRGIRRDLNCNNCYETSVTTRNVKGGIYNIPLLRLEIEQ